MTDLEMWNVVGGYESGKGYPKVSIPAPVLQKKR